MAIRMTEFSASASGNLSTVERMSWDLLKVKLSPVVWAWYDQHKDMKITTILKVYTVTLSSFGIAEAIISHLFTPRLGATT